jgi:hypothetical protein
MPKKKAVDEANQETMKRISVELVLNAESGRYVREDGAIGKKILEKQKEEEKRLTEERDKTVAVATPAEMEKFILEVQLDEAQKENERLRGLVSPELLAATYEAPCIHGWFNTQKLFGHEQWRCKVCYKDWKPFGELSGEEAREKALEKAREKAPEKAPEKASVKATRFVSAIHNVAVVAQVSAKLEEIAEEELEQAAAGIGGSRPRIRVGKSGLKSNLTDDFATMFFPAQKDACEKGKGGARPARK